MHKNITKGKVQLKILITSADENITQALDSIVLASGHISKSVTDYENFSEECNKIGADLALIDSSVKFGGKERHILELIRDLRHDIQHPSCKTLESAHTLVLDEDRSQDDGDSTAKTSHHLPSVGYDEGG